MYISINFNLHVEITNNSCSPSSIFHKNISTFENKCIANNECNRYFKYLYTFVLDLYVELHKHN